MKNIFNRKFNGFSVETLTFLSTNNTNNSKQWFEAHRQDYQQFLLEPMQNLVLDLGEFMLTIDPLLEIAPKVNKTISKIYRDTRFSRDKSLFKNNMWLSFKRPLAEWKDRPVFFFELFPDWYRYGMGFYSASKTTMDRLRQSIDENPDRFLAVVSFLSKQDVFTVAGENYKRILDPSKSGILLEWYQRKNFYLVCNRDVDDSLFSARLVDDLINNFGMIAPFYQYLWNVII